MCRPIETSGHLLGGPMNSILQQSLLQGSMPTYDKPIASFVPPVMNLSNAPMNPMNLMAMAQQQSVNSNMMNLMANNMNNMLMPNYVKPTFDIQTILPANNSSIVSNSVLENRIVPAPNASLTFDEINQKPSLEETSSSLSIDLQDPNSLEVVDVGTFEDLLDYSLPDEDMKDNEALGMFNVDEEFDSTEMSILYSFLVENQMEDPNQSSSTCDNETIRPLSKPTAMNGGMEKTRTNSLELPDHSVLTVNLMANSPLDSLLDMTSEEDVCLTDIELKPPLSYYDSHNTSPALGSFLTEDLLNYDGKVNNDNNMATDSYKLPNMGNNVKSRRLCKMEGCDKRSRSHGLCIAHGGGRRCAIEGCDKSSQGGNLCIRHGGGKRCNIDGCEKAAQSNLLCKAHGGGPRCMYRGCDRSSQGGGFCRSHGGGKRCLYPKCDKGTQRGDYCALHGGSRLCGVQGCMRNDRGGGFCATHGGGKRCSIDGCVKPCRRKGMCSAHLRQYGGNPEVVE